MTGKKAGNRILAITPAWENMLEPGSTLRDLSFGDGTLHGIANGRNLPGGRLTAEELSALQNYVWGKFTRWMAP